LEMTGFSEGILPFTYLGMLVTANMLGKLECRQLVDKITARVKQWAIK